MSEADEYRLSFEIECHKMTDHSEFCRVFFRPASPFPRYLHFGLDESHFDPYKKFMRRNAGLVVGRYDKLIVHVWNDRTRGTSRLDIDLEPYWPTGIRPGEVKARLSSIDVTTAIKDMI